MRERSSIKNNEHQIAYNTIQSVDNSKNPAAVFLGHLGGLKGGKARAEKLSAKRRSEIAYKAATMRWNAK